MPDKRPQQGGKAASAQIFKQAATADPLKGQGALHDAEHYDAHTVQQRHPASRGQTCCLKSSLLGFFGFFTSQSFLSFPHTEAHYVCILPTLS